MRNGRWNLRKMEGVRWRWEVCANGDRKWGEVEMGYGGWGSDDGRWTLDAEMGWETEIGESWEVNFAGMEGGKWTRIT